MEHFGNHSDLRDKGEDKGVLPFCCGIEPGDSLYSSYSSVSAAKWGWNLFPNWFLG